VRSDGALDVVRAIANDEAEDLAAVMHAALNASGSVRPTVCVLAIAAPVDGDEVTLTNRRWRFSQRALRRELKLTRLTVVNDFVAVAHAMPTLRAADLVSVGGGRSEPRGTMLVCGPGTGFGVATLLRQSGKPRAIPSEAGHMRLGAATADEARVVAHLVRDVGAVSIEHVLSGPGLVRLHRVLSGEEASTKQIIEAARLGRGAARETIHAFLRLFGRVAGDLALAFDARGGVFMAGGIGRVLAPFYASSPFRDAFEEHPPYQARLAAIPTHAIVHAAPGLVGAAALARTIRRR
jgi:glucokinase